MSRRLRPTIVRANSKASAKKPSFQGWKTTDQEEVERRRLRAAASPIFIEAIEPDQPIFGAFIARSESASSVPYIVEIRSLGDLRNSCSCPDFMVNGLGTCKHIEAVVVRIKRENREFIQSTGILESPRAEVYLSRAGAPEIRIAWPQKKSRALQRMLDPFFGSSGALLAEPIWAVPSLTRTVAESTRKMRAQIRIGRDVGEWAAEMRRRHERQRAREDFMRDVEGRKRTLNCLKSPLYPYQQEGMLHLAFGERALLADDMGLGKTVQAIAACELLRQTRKIERVLVVAPASLKAEWEEQIAKFTGLPARIVWGPRSERLKLYREPSFFYLANYEQIRVDVEDIGRLLAPDVVILDEAQRIKNWQTATARSVKRLASPYAFVLTGTPLENRIDEIYSIFQFLDPQVLGPLFRFNREFYEIGERGFPEGYKNLDELHRRIRPLMLRRRKDEVEDQLPERTTNNYFVGMTAEQSTRYEEYNAKVARLSAIAQRRPLTQEESEQLQRWLACMRMLCDTPFILDPKCLDCPKLDELRSILEDILADGSSKVLIFSEWERMLQLVRGVVEEMEIGYAWHTGSVPQQRRRGEIHRFKNDPDCRLFLSTDSGSVGLNLQAANVVINLDLPWNPAELEERIARAWRKHQARSVTVINLVTSGSIEHRMLPLLQQKQELSDGVLDGRGDLQSIKMPSGRAAFLERLQSLLGTSIENQPTSSSNVEGAAPANAAGDPYEAFRDDVASRLSDRLVLIESASPNGTASLLVVVESAPLQFADLIQKALLRHFRNAGTPPRLEILDRATYETIQRLVHSGILKPGAETPRRIFQNAATTPDEAEVEHMRSAVRSLLQLADRKMRMSDLLIDGGFALEALPPVRETTETTLRALVRLHRGRQAAEDHEVSLRELEPVLTKAELVPESIIAFVACLRDTANGNVDEDTARQLHHSAKLLLDQTRVAINRNALR